MRLLTHNMLQCPRTRTYPLSLHIDTCDEIQVDFNALFIRRMLPRLDWSVFLSAAQQLPDEDLVSQLPEQPPSEDTLDDSETMRAVHRALLQWHVVEGTLTAQGEAIYKVTNGVPNLVITEVRKEEQAKPDADMQPVNGTSDDGSANS